ncbi:uncharacterized protein LOC106168921 [Lingula anatina]|uniref:Uncharacterized protein LOC106168921 n=1 Tax=Lingula anatina TaxID=7574 RepID=A0A1S3IZL1_LINAN|nr:uncharacterized protein LOC106168921 [Lingula anatina]|eukprot:XP_013403637.1 uncharacterized protein LOC106168921 [Lingula anatina]
MKSCALLVLLVLFAAVVIEDTSGQAVAYATCNCCGHECSSDHGSCECGGIPPNCYCAAADHTTRELIQSPATTTSIGTMKSCALLVLLVLFVAVVIEDTAGQGIARATCTCCGQICHTDSGTCTCGGVAPNCYCIAIDYTTRGPPSPATP